MHAFLPVHTPARRPSAGYGLTFGCSSESVQKKVEGKKITLTLSLKSLAALRETAVSLSKCLTKLRDETPRVAHEFASVLPVNVAVGGGREV
jgi:methylthioribose-1-phosphate isomerase